MSKKETRDMPNPVDGLLPRMARDMTAEKIVVRAADNTITFAASSEQPVERWFGSEILSHSENAIRLGRIADGAAPLLFNHDWDDPVGMLDGGRIENGRLMVDAHFFDTSRAKEVRAMLDGGLRNVSIGYEIHVMEEEAKGQRYTATDWEPLEVSIVTVPADPSVGIGREKDSKPKPVRIVRANQQAESADSKGAEMADQENAPAGATADDNAQADKSQNRAASHTSTEELRRSTIEKMCREHKVSEETMREWRDDECLSPDDAARRILDIMLIRSSAADKKKAAPSEIGMSRAEVEKFSVMKALRAIVNKDWSKAGLELEAHKAIQQRMGGNPLNEQSFYVPLEIQRRAHAKRDMTTAGVSGSDNLVGTDNMSFIDLLRNRSVAMRMGARMMGGLVGNVTIPRQTASGTAQWLTSESTEISESQPTIGQLSLSPKHVGAYTEISRLLALQSSPDAEALVMSDLAQTVGTAVDKAVMHGSGASGQPQGIVGTSGVGSVTGTSLGYAGLLECQTDIGNALQAGAALGYVTTGAVAALLAARVKFADTASPLWDGSLLDADVCGFPGMSSAQVDAATLIFGDWAQVIIAEWGSLAIEVNPYANFQAGIIGVRAMYAVDVGVRIPSAFTVAGTIT
jgi:HK97 family phage major capsid protein/HK97 family phage prohead protease